MASNLLLLLIAKQPGALLAGSPVPAKTTQNGTAIREQALLFSQMFSGLAGDAIEEWKSKSSNPQLRVRPEQEAAFQKPPAPPEGVAQQAVGDQDEPTAPTTNSGSDAIESVFAKMNSDTPSDGAFKPSRPGASSVGKKEKSSSLSSGVNFAAGAKPDAPKARFVPRIGRRHIEPDQRLESGVSDSEALSESIRDAKPSRKLSDSGASEDFPQSIKSARSQNPEDQTKTLHSMPVISQPVQVQGSIRLPEARPVGTPDLQGETESGPQFSAVSSQSDEGTGPSKMEDRAKSSDSTWQPMAGLFAVGARAVKDVQAQQEERSDSRPQSHSEVREIRSEVAAHVPESGWRVSNPEELRGPEMLIPEPASPEPATTSNRISSGISVGALPGSRSTAPLAFALRLLPDLLAKNAPNAPPTTSFRPESDGSPITKIEPALPSGPPRDEPSVVQKPAPAPTPRMRAPSEADEETPAGGRQNSDSGLAGTFPRAIPQTAQESPNPPQMTEKPPEITPGPPPISPEMQTAPVHNSTAAPAHDIQFQVERGAQRVDVRLTDRGGAVHVSVRTPDAQLAGTLREDLPGLSARLEQVGFRSETLQAPSDPSPGHPRTFQPGITPGSQEFNGNSQPHHGGQQPSQDNPHHPKKQDREVDDSSPRRKEFSWFMSNAR